MEMSLLLVCRFCDLKRNSFLQAGFVAGQDGDTAVYPETFVCDLV